MQIKIKGKKDSQKNIIQGGPKKFYDVILRKSVREILKYFFMESFSLCIHIFLRS